MTIVGFAKHSSTTPMKQLKPILDTIRRHQGRYLLCRFITPCVRMSAVQAVAEDLEGSAFSLSMYNFPGSLGCSADYLDALFPVGTIIAIREPTFKTATQGPYPIVRVDSPTDIVFVESHNQILNISHWSTGPHILMSLPFPTTTEGWKARGNAFFKAAQWLPAALAYSYGIALDKDAIVLYLNRSEAYLRLKFYSGALADVQRVLSAPGISDAFRGKALAREGKAEYARGNYQDAERKFDAWCQIHPDDKEIPAWIIRCQQRTRESRTGEYDWARLFKLSLTDPHLDDVADYQGPIEVRQVQGRGGGRGVVATRDIKVGELLLVSKPFVSIYEQDLRAGGHTVAINLLTSRTESHTQSATVSHAIQKIYGNPELHALVFHLYAGPSYPSPPLSYPPAIPQEPIHVDMLSSNIDIDVAQLEAICSHNCFAPISLQQPHYAHGGQPQDANKALAEEGTGLYLLPSLFNHACAANATRCCIGDVMLIRARESIRAGDEITIPYINHSSYEERTKDLRQWLPNGCDCWLCGEDRKDMEDARLRRDKLAEELAEELKFVRLCRSSLARVRFLEKQLAATYSSSRGPVDLKPLMASAQHAIAKMLIQIDPHAMKEAVAEDKRALQSLGFVLPDERSTGPSPASANSLGLPITTDRIPSATSFSEPIFIIFGMVQSFLKLKDEANAVKWLRAALWILDMSVGGGKNFFMAFMDSTLQYLGLKKFAKRVL
ncbi:hypothetical protein B0H21DRAFT_739825 [Amylocystis lapponica]|nr:hypothetical protein B0H21DRAFT_739825 [Amylocystis lapponica]